MMQGPPLPSCGGPYIPGTYGSIMKQNKLSYKIGQFLMFGGPATILFFAW